MNPARAFIIAHDDYEDDRAPLPDHETWMCLHQSADRIDALEAEIAQIRQWAMNGLGSCPCCDQTVWPAFWGDSELISHGDGPPFAMTCVNCCYRFSRADDIVAAWKAAAEEMGKEPSE